MSMVKCKCDKVFDSDEQLNFDEKGDCICDACYDQLAFELEHTLTNIFSQVKWGEGHDTIGSIVDRLLEENYRKVR